ncbi:hypothetical protein [Streptomyces sp. NPDC001594]|uniref:hypothetical protein n=1 Tax=Streptomyces sp. NPDC001594 TaxID=3364590 RepID=UPI003674112B
MDTESLLAPHAVLINGTVGVGKTSVAEGAEDREAIADALGTRLSVCRLRADLPAIHQRLTHRHAHEPEALRWHLAGSGELAAILERAAVDDFTLDVTTSSIPETATDVLAQLGWS